MSTDNPIKTFFSPQNVRNLYQTLQKGLSERGIVIDDRYMKQLVEIMKMVVEPLPKRIPATVDRNQLIQTLNKQALKEAISVFTAINSAPPSGPSLSEQSRMPDPPVNARMTLGSGPRPQQSTPIRAVGNTDSNETEAALNQLVSERAPRVLQTQPQPKFEDDVPQYPEDINDLYEWAEQSRQQQDILPPPLIQPAIAAAQSTEIRRTPATYEPAKPPRGSERIEEQTPKEIPPDFSQLTFANTLPPAGPPPQPSEMRVLIPAVSRNNVPDSHAIPHVFVVCSSDRFTTAYPSPSNYRIRLRDPYLDVVSVELTNAVLPLSAYNVNSSNNVIYFRETALGDIIPAVIPVGNYPDTSAVAFAVAASMTAASINGVTYTASVDPLTNKITITSDGFGGSILDLLFLGTPTQQDDGLENPQLPTNSIGGVLGYSPAEYTGSLTYEAPNVPNIDGEPFAYIHVEELHTIESNNSAVHNAFAAIPMATDDSTRGYITFTQESGVPIKYFSPPAGKLSYLTISIRTSTGELFDFNGRDNTLTFTITTKDKTQPNYDTL